MHITDTRKCNWWGLESLAVYLGVAVSVLNDYYRELIEDRPFLDALNARVRHSRKMGFTKGIFRKQRIASIDWFAFERVLIYVLVRHLKPEVCLETGVYYGGNTAFLLNALARNGKGRLISIDYPDSSIRETGAFDRHPDVGESELYDPTLRSGFLVPQSLQDRWTLVLGDSLTEIAKLDAVFDFYIHDSEHSFGFLSRELREAEKKLSPSATIVVDDIDWSIAFFAYCVERRLFPLCLTDNGKDNLRVRTGVVKMDNPKNNAPAYTRP